MLTHTAQLSLSASFNPVFILVLVAVLALVLLGVYWSWRAAGVAFVLLLVVVAIALGGNTIKLLGPVSKSADVASTLTGTSFADSVKKDYNQQVVSVNSLGPDPKHPEAGYYVSEITVKDPTAGEEKCAVRAFENYQDSGNAILRYALFCGEPLASNIVSGNYSDPSEK